MTMTHEQATEYFESANAGRGPDIVAEISDDDLAALVAAKQAVTAADAALAATVASARARGVTWAAIGAALGVSRQAAQAKFAKVA